MMCKKCIEKLDLEPISETGRTAVCSECNIKKYCFYFEEKDTKTVCSSVRGGGKTAAMNAHIKALNSAIGAVASLLELIKITDKNLYNEVVKGLKCEKS